MTALHADFRMDYAPEIREGYAARGAGGDCPYADGTQLSIAWHYGWDWADTRATRWAPLQTPPPTKRPDSGTEKEQGPLLRLKPLACPGAGSRLFTGASPYDVRPALVDLCYREDWTRLRQVFQAGMDWLLVSRSMVVRALNREQLAGVVTHGLGRLLCQDHKSRFWPGDKDSAAKRYGMARAPFRALSDALFQRYRLWLYEGAIRFIQAAANSEEPGKAGTLASPMANTSFRYRRRPDAPVLTLEAGEAAAHMARRPSSGHLSKWKVGNSRPPTLPSERTRVVGPRLIEDHDVLANVEALEIEQAA